MANNAARSHCESGLPARARPLCFWQGAKARSNVSRHRRGATHKQQTPGWKSRVRRQRIVRAGVTAGWLVRFQRSLLTKYDMDKTILRGEDDLVTAVTKMSKGNPGAIRALMCLLEDTTTDPDSVLGGLGLITLLDFKGIYGTDIYVLWADICGRSTPKMIAVLRACQLGLFDIAVVKEAAGRQDYSGRELVNPDALVAAVKERLPRFGKNI